MGSEFSKKGVNVLLGPVVGPMGRVVLSGRNWEGLSLTVSNPQEGLSVDNCGLGFSSDPYPAGALVYKTVEVTQNVGVITSVKAS